jgi:serine/threonine-protein kinase HipA
VGTQGHYILKPQTDQYRHLPEIEDLTMHLAELAGIRTVPHSLIRLKAGSLAYITKRIDRTGQGKIHMEDMCQLTGRLTEHKYRGSYEQIATAILNYSQGPVLDLINFFEIVIFSFLTGNHDMHFKNFSLTDIPGMGYYLSAAYDLVASTLVTEGDDEELALNLNGRKRKLRKSDFDHFYTHIDIPAKSRENSYKRFSKAIPVWLDFIEISILPKATKAAYKSLIRARAQRLDLV